MKIVHIATTDFGGAFKAVERIQESLEYYQEQSEILVRSRFFETNTTEVINTSGKKLLSKSKNFVNLLLSRGEVVTDWLGTDLSKNIKVQEADVIILHWVNSFVSPKTISKLMKLKKPIIWVMHDMWVFTGGCHYDNYCEGYTANCGKCPFLKKKWKRDISYYNLKKKKQLFCSVDITFVAVSNWEKECAKKSLPLRKKEIIWIPNPINVEIFKPLEDKEIIKKKNGLSSKKIILFGADKALENPTKGFQYLLKALEYLDESKYVAVCVGKAPEGKQTILSKVEMIYLGTIYEEQILAEWYNIADVFVAPSLQESFGYTVCEALACGTPVTAFAVGGILDQIEHRENGYLAELYNTKELAEGIEFCAEHKKVLGQNARNAVLERNSYQVIGEKYQRLCQMSLKKYNLKE